MGKYLVLDFGVKGYLKSRTEQLKIYIVIKKISLNNSARIF